jgi:hypothetical protein
MPYEIRHESPGYLGAMGNIGYLSGQKVRKDEDQARADQLHREEEQRQLAYDQMRQQLILDQNRQQGFRSREASQERIEAMRQQGYLQRELVQGEMQAQQKETELRNKLQSGEFQYSMQQKRDMQRIWNSIDMIRNSPEWEPEQKKKAIQALQMKAAGIKYNPMPYIKEPSPWQEGQEPGSVWTDEETGSRLTRDKDGNVKVLSDGFTPEKNMKLIEIAMRNAMDEDGYFNINLFKQMYQAAKDLMMVGQEVKQPAFQKPSIPIPHYLPQPGQAMTSGQPSQTMDTQTPTPSATPPTIGSKAEQLERTLQKLPPAKQQSVRNLILVYLEGIKSARESNDVTREMRHRRSLHQLLDDLRGQRQ